MPHFRTYAAIRATALVTHPAEISEATLPALCDLPRALFLVDDGTVRTVIGTLRRCAALYSDVALALNTRLVELPKRRLVAVPERRQLEVGDVTRCTAGRRRSGAWRQSPNAISDR